MSKDEYVLFDDADFDKVRLESTRTISIDQFVDEDEIDRLYWDAPFYVVPETGVGVEAFAVIRGGDEVGGQDRHRQPGAARAERQLALEVRGKGWWPGSLRPHEEVRDADEFFDDIPGGESRQATWSRSP